jgi:hypothetical protein
MLHPAAISTSVVLLGRLLVTGGLIALAAVAARRR